MVKRMVNDEDLDDLISALVSSGYEVIAPKEEGGRVLHRAIEKGSEFARDYLNAQNSPKDFLFPRREGLFSFTKNGRIEEVKPYSSKMVFLGVRPCDAMAVANLDKLFNWDYRDTYYNMRRSSSILIGLACNEPAPTCFCTSLGEGLGPHQKEHVDIMLTKLDNFNYSMESVSEAGKELMSLAPSGFSATQGHDERTLELKEEAEKRIKKRFNFGEVFKVLDENFDSPYWKAATRKCIGCGICTYICPSCHCFDILDEDGVRVRFWDSCQFALYSKHAVGYNPRNQNYKRLRNRIYHKFVYFRKNLGVPLCTGCGRCMIYCPMKVDISKIVSEAKTRILKNGKRVSVDGN